MADLTKLQARLLLVEEAIDRILEGSQSVTIHGKSYTEADLAYLRRWEDELESKIAKMSGTRSGGMVTAYGIPT
jgi:hypothetical protein